MELPCDSYNHVSLEEQNVPFPIARQLIKLAYRKKELSIDIKQRSLGSGRPLIAVDHDNRQRSPALRERPLTQIELPAGLSTYTNFAKHESVLPRPKPAKGS